MKKAIGLMFVIASASSLAMAGAPLNGVVPEIDAASAMGALALLGGGIAVLRARLKK